MGECLLVKSASVKNTLPILSTSYPQDKSITFISGNTASATFEVRIEVDGEPNEYTYQWYVNNSAVSGATGASYNWSGTSGGTYSIRCDVTNKAGTVQSRTATLKANMQYKPTLNSSYPADATVEIFGNATFEVKIAEHGNPSEYTYKWYQNDVLLSDRTGSSFTYNNLTALGTYKIRCEVTNAVGTVQSRTATLTVTEKYLYKPGMTSLSTMGWRAYWSQEPHAPSLSYGSSYATAQIALDIGGRTGIVYPPKVDLTKYSYIRCHVVISGTTDSYYNDANGLFVWQPGSFGQNQYAYESAVAKSWYWAAGEHNVTLDISGLSGEHYLGLGMRRHNDTITYKIYSISLG